MAGILDILADGIEAEEARKAAQRERTRRARDKQRNVTATLQSRDRNSDDTHGRATRVEDKTSNPEIEPQQKERNALTREFDQTFWPEYPNKTGKPKALTSFVAARKRASLDAIMAGLRRYVASKPVDRAWLNPATFLNQDRWADEPAPVARAGPSPPRRGLGDVFGEFGDFLDGQGHGGGDDQAPQGVVLRLPQRAAQ
jgi:hypothetical protein